MKRDYDYLRKLMFDIEEREDHLYLFALTMGSSKEEQKKYHHLNLLCDVGYLQKVNKHAYRLTSMGHDFIDSVRDGGIWEKTKSVVAETGGNATIELVKKVAHELLAKKLREHTGIDL